MCRVTPLSSRGCRRAFAAIGLLLVLALLPTPTATQAAAPTPAADSRTAAGTVPKFSPGRFGRLTAGMTARQAMRTGMVRWVGRGEPCGRQLELKRPYRRSVVFEFSERHLGGNGRIILMATYRSRFPTSARVRVGDTVGSVEVAYGSRLRGPWENYYGQGVYLVRGQDRRNLTFFAADPDDQVAPVVGILVSEGRPITIYEGEGPC